MKLYYYQDVPNFGDMLNKHMWPHFFGNLIARSDDWLMFGIGTLIGAKVEHQGRIAVFGSGVGYQKDVRAVLDPRYQIEFVRGPLSAQVLGLPADRAITDPAILAPEVFPATPKDNSVIFIPHWETSLNPLWRRVCALAGITYVDPLADVGEVIARISAARLVITEAMHGAILADAYRVPWVAVSTSPRINIFKWHDWAQSLRMSPPEFSFFDRIGVSDFMRAATHDSATMRSIVQHVCGIDESMTKEFVRQPDGCLLRSANWALEHLVPIRFRYGVDKLLMNRIGPVCDKALDWLAGRGLVWPALRRAAAQLEELARQSGQLSDEAVVAERRAQIHEKIRTLPEKLAA